MADSAFDSDSSRKDAEARERAANAPEAVEEESERESVQEASRLSAKLIFEVIRRDGQEEIARPVSSLIFSALAAGNLIAFSVLGEAILRAYLPKGQDWTHLVENLGYALGFLLVIHGRMQLFTENTITTVLPVIAHPCRENLWLAGRLWAVVLGFNVVGAFIAAIFVAYSQAFPPEVMAAFKELSHHATSFDPGVAFMKALPAGMLVAAIVWMLPTVPRNPFLIITTFTWLIAAGDFAHIVAGSVEMAYMLVIGELSVFKAAFHFFLPVLLGNIVGGTAVFTVITWAQIRAEVPHS